MLDLKVWQYNAYCAGHKLQQLDSLALQIQAAYYEAYWNGFSKHKRSLDSVIKELYRDSKPHKQATFEKDEIEELEKDFKNAEDLKDHGWAKG